MRPLKKDRTDFVDQRGSLRDEARPNPMQRLKIELLFALEIDEPHRGARRGFGDALRIPFVVLTSEGIPPEARTDLSVASLGTQLPNFENRRLSGMMNDGVTSP